MKTLIPWVALVATGCALAVLTESEIAGTYSYASFDAALQLQLFPDGTYEEYFLALYNLRESPSGELVAPREERGKGHWTVTSGGVRLDPDEGDSRRLKIRGENGVLELRERDRVFERIVYEPVEQPGSGNTG